MALQVFDPAAFKAIFTEFAALSDSTLTAYWSMASQYVNPNDGTILAGPELLLAVQLMTAHLAKIYQALGSGQNAGGVLTGATEGGVSVSLAPPPAKSGWQFWLNQTPYGTQLWALLETQTAGGIFVGGSCERGAFRKTGGVF